ncbi:MAG TPA: C45 family peptidase [Myxococcota bacterium]|nr:C45 family peptidase [Myxococcota bacterium]
MLRRILVGAAVFAALLVIAYGLFVWTVAIDAPDTPEPPAIVTRVDGGRVVFGKSWMARRGKIWEVHLRGDPFEMGYAHGRLAMFFHRRADHHMAEMAETFVPNRFVRWGLYNFLRWRYRKVADALPAALQMELAGIARGYEPDPYQDMIDTYERVVFYHALHDITQPLVHSPLLGCTAFAASGRATAGGRLIIGRNFDFDGGDIFDTDKAVLFFEPDEGIPFASVGWPGLAGVVTGLNAEGVYLSVNAGRVKDPSNEGMPIILLVRWVLQHAHSMADAIDLLKAHAVMVGDIILVGDGETGESAVVELGPGKVGVRGPDEHGVLVAANHFLTDALKDDPGNVDAVRTLSSTHRYERMLEALGHHEGAIDPGRALSVLRDRLGAGGKPLGPGNRNALDALIATHSVVVDASARVLWVTEAPHTLGRAVAFDLRRELGPAAGSVPLGPPPLDFPEDPYLHDGYETYVAAKTLYLEALALAEAGQAAEAADAARRALAVLPSHPLAHKLLGDLYMKEGRIELARDHYAAFLGGSPASGDEVDDVKAKLARLGAPAGTAGAGAAPAAAAGSGAAGAATP